MNRTPTNRTPSKLSPAKRKTSKLSKRTKKVEKSKKIFEIEEDNKSLFGDYDFEIDLGTLMCETPMYDPGCRTPDIMFNAKDLVFDDGPLIVPSPHVEMKTSLCIFFFDF